MDFFNKAKESFSMASRGLAQKATDVSGAARFNLKIRDEEKELEEAYRKLGQAVYERAEDSVRGFFPNEIREISELLSALEEDRKQLAVFRGMKICPNCGAEQEAEAMNCTVCGINMAEAARIREEMSARFCTRCGEKLAPGAKFCMNCGNPAE